MDISSWTAGIFVPKRRSIGSFPLQVTISESERDTLQVTRHPIEQGAPISDHAYKEPTEVTFRAGWNAQNNDLSATGNGVYGLLLSMQASLQPLTVYTGKRTHKDMLISSLVVTTDQHSEFALMADIVCQQVILVKTSVAKAATAATGEDMKSPESNAPAKEGGDKQPRPVGNGGVLRDPIDPEPDQFGPPAPGAQAAPVKQEYQPPLTPEATKVEFGSINNGAAPLEKGYEITFPQSALP